jgi:hypothetical protein
LQVSVVQTLLSLHVIGVPGWQPSCESHVSMPLHWLPSSQTGQRRIEPEFESPAASGGVVLQTPSPRAAS